MEQVMTTWILVADACGARLFMSFDQVRSIHLIQRFTHADSRAMESELVSDKQGSARSMVYPGARTMQPHMAQKELEAMHFAQRLNHHLHDAAHHNKFDALVLVAPPHFLGLLRAELSPTLTRLVTTSLAKDLIYMDEKTIQEHLAKAVRPARQA
jgi:protein required for attachment to host cells